MDMWAIVLVFGFTLHLMQSRSPSWALESHLLLLSASQSHFGHPGLHLLLTCHATLYSYFGARVSAASHAGCFVLPPPLDCMGYCFLTTCKHLLSCHLLKRPCVTKLMLETTLFTAFIPLSSFFFTITHITVYHFYLLICLLCVSCF